MKLNTKLLCITGALLSLPLIASAQSINSRHTQLNWSALYGGGPIGFSPSDSFTTNDLVASDSNSLSFSDEQSGDFPIGWTAGVALETAQSHLVTGSFANFESISVSMDGMKSQFATGIGNAGIGSIMPGNEFIMEFDVASSMNYQLNGSLFYDLDGQFVNASTKVQFHNGTEWEDIIGLNTSFGDNDQDYDFTGALGSGSYRIVANMTMPAGYSTYQANNSFTFTNTDAVPEPATLVVLGAAGAFFARRRKRN